MANPSTATSNTASAAVDEAVRIAAQNSRRTTESVQAALQASRAYVEQANRFNRDLFALYTAGLDAGLQTAFEMQSVGLANAQSLFDSYAGIGKTAISRYADLAKQVQATTLKTYQAGARFWSETFSIPE